MSRIPVLLVAVLLVAVPAAALTGGHAAGPTVTDTRSPSLGSRTPNATNVLLLSGSGEAAFTNATVTVTAAVGASQAGLDGAFSTQRLDARLAAASSDADRLAILRNATTAAANRTNAIVTTEAKARTAFADGRLSAHSLVQRVAIDSARADALSAYLKAVRSHAVDLHAQRSLLDRVSALSGRLTAYDTGSDSLRSLLAAAVSGKRPPLRVFVSASGNGLTLAAVDGGTYYHSTYRVDNYDAAPASGGVDLGSFSTSLRSLYPTTWNLSANGGRQAYSAPGGAYLYRAVLGYSRSGGQQSTLVVYLDPSTDAVYREDKQVSPSDVAPGPAVSHTTDGVTLSVDRTYPGGPMRVAVANATGAPLEATVLVNGTDVGQTTPRTGATWTVSPAGTFTVTAATRNATVSLEATAIHRP